VQVCSQTLVPSVEIALRLPARAHPPRRACGARRALCVAGAPAVAQEVDVQLELGAGRGDASSSWCSSSNGAPGRSRCRRIPTRETWVSTHQSGGEDFLSESD
jgi:hypothetical protein